MAECLIGIGERFVQFGRSLDCLFYVSADTGKGFFQSLRGLKVI
jgi:hypothetical protein